MQRVEMSRNSIVFQALCGEGALHVAGADSVDMYAMWCEIQGGALRQAHDEMLRRDVGGSSSGCDMSHDAC